jgi:hypothetical protein
VDLKKIAYGFVIEFIGVMLILYMGNGDFSTVNTLKWVGVILMIGVPFLFWEVLTIRDTAH